MCQIAVYITARTEDLIWVGWGFTLVTGHIGSFSSFWNMFLKALWELRCIYGARTDSAASGALFSLWPGGNHPYLEVVFYASLAFWVLLGWFVGLCFFGFFFYLVELWKEYSL